jgi:ATP adenylyltransferase
MNKYPYNAGHLMIVPRAHKGKLGQLTTSESNEMFELTRSSVEVLEKSMPTAGFNIGLNIGSEAGAGIKDHIHIHIVPRFRGDTNFMTVVGEIKVQSISIVDIYDMIKPGFDQLRDRS